MSHEYITPLIVCAAGTLNSEVYACAMHIDTSRFIGTIHIFGSIRTVRMVNRLYQPEAEKLLLVCSKISLRWAK